MAVGANGRLIAANSACTAGVAWDATINISGSLVGIGQTSPSFTLDVGGGNPTVARVTGACGVQLILNRGASPNPAAINFRTSNTENFVLGTGIFAGGTLFQITNAASQLMAVDTNGIVYIGQSTSSNNNMTRGLTIDQGTAVDEILALKNSAVTHGITDYAETDTFYGVQVALTDGGTYSYVRSYGEATVGFYHRSVITTGCSTRTTAARAAIQLDGALKSGTTASTLSNDQNVLTVGNFGSNRFIFDSDGDLHADAAVNASAFDAYDDAQLVRTLMVECAPQNIVKTEFDRWLRYNRANLTQLKIATFNDHPGGDGSIFVNYMGLARLHSGALWQAYVARKELEEKLRRLINLLETRTGSLFDLENQGEQISLPCQ